MSRYILVMFLSVTIASCSQILLKKSALNSHDNVIKEYLNIWVIGGYFLLGLSMCMTVYAYSGMEFKNGPIIEAFGNVLVPLFSFLIFKEKMNLKKIIGIVCIVIGVIVFNV